MPHSAFSSCSKQNKTPKIWKFHPRKLLGDRSIAAGIIISVIMVGGMVLEIAGEKEKTFLAINGQIISAFVAGSESEKAKGLSGRLGLRENEGMIFIFDTVGRYGFWMKDMKFPIDIIWIRGREIVGIEKNIPPPVKSGSAHGDRFLKIYYPPEPVDMVLEMSSGGADFINARVGDEAEITAR